MFLSATSQEPPAAPTSCAHAGFEENTLPAVPAAASPTTPGGDVGDDAGGRGSGASADSGSDSLSPSGGEALALATESLALAKETLAMATGAVATATGAGGIMAWFESAKISGAKLVGAMAVCKDQDIETVDELKLMCVLSCAARLAGALLHSVMTDRSRRSWCRWSRGKLETLGFK